LSKKKKIEALDDTEKLLPIDTLGIVMITHGKEFSETSAFGTLRHAYHPGYFATSINTGSSLVQLGRAHCKVATLQDAFALTLKATFMTSLEKFTDEIKEYEVQRKKLDSRRYVLVPIEVFLLIEVIG
jgi:BAR domain